MPQRTLDFGLASIGVVVFERGDVVDIAPASARGCRPLADGPRKCDKLRICRIGDQRGESESYNGNYQPPVSNTLLKHGTRFVRVNSQRRTHRCPAQLRMQRPFFANGFCMTRERVIVERDGAAGQKLMSSAERGV